MAGEMWTLEQTRIGQAIKQNSIPDLQAALEDGENVEFQDRKGNTYLHYVCSMNRPYIFNILAASPIDINARNKHGNTALHVTALHKECGHVSDLMTCGADPFIKNKEGKIAAQLVPKAVYWQTIYNKYQPGIFQAVEEHDVERVRQLLHCWCRTDAVRDGQTLRQFAAARKHHDIVLMLDQHRFTSDAIFGVLEVNHGKVKHSTASEKCNINFLNQASELHHILLHALRLKDERMVKLVCRAGANVNLPIHLDTYIKAPMYFAAISPHVPLDIVWTVLKSQPDFLLKDQRGRNAVTFAIDKSDRKVPLEVIQYMMQNGVYLGDRDMTGLTARDVARLARRQDIVALLDRMYIKLLRGEEMLKLERLTQDGYDSMLISFNHRDTFIYACGNERDTVVQFVQQLPAFQSRVCQLQTAVKSQAVDQIRQLIEDYSEPHLLANCKDKGGRGLLHLSVLHWRTDVSAYLLSLPYIDFNAQDNQLRTAYHYAAAMREEEREIFKTQLQDAGCDTTVLDCSWLTATDYENKPEEAMDLGKERTVVYGMSKRLLCLDKYEELRGIIRKKRKSLKDFKDAIKHFKYPVSSFARLLAPVVDEYRDLIFLAVDKGKADIAEYLANIGSNLVRKEKYIVKEDPPTEPDHTSSKASTYTPDIHATPSQPTPSNESEQSYLLPHEDPNDLLLQELPGVDTAHKSGDSQEKSQEKPPTRKPVEKVEYLSVVQRARQLGMDDLVAVFETKLEFRRARKRMEKGVDDDDDDDDDDDEDEDGVEDNEEVDAYDDESIDYNLEFCDSGSGFVEGEEYFSADDYMSDFDADFVEDL